MAANGQARLGQAIDDVLADPNERDSFSFVVSVRATYTFFTTGSTNTSGSLLDATGRAIATDSDTGESTNFLITRTLDPGTYFVEVTGQPFANNNSGNYRLHLEGPGAGTLTDDHGFSPWSATAVLVGSAPSGTLSLPDDSDYFKFTVTSRAKYTFFSTGSTNTLGALYDAGYNQLQSDSDSGEGANFRIDRTLDPGTYFVEVTGQPFTSNNSGNYRLHLEGPGAGTQTDDHGFSPWSATAVLVGSAPSGTLSLPDDSDYFKFTVTSRAKYTFFSTGSTNTLGALYDAGYNQLQSDSDSGEGANFRIDRTLDPGTYFVEVTGQPFTSNNSGNYRLHLEGPGAGTLTDDHGFSPWSATAVLVGSAPSGTLSLPDDSDYFKFTVTSRAKYTFFSTGSTNTLGALYDAGYNQLQSDSDSGEGANFRIDRTLDPGTYFVEVTGQPFTSNNSGNYRLHLEGPGAGTLTDDHGFSPWSATAVLVGSAPSGTLSLPDDCDYFKFTVTSRGPYSVFTNGDTDTLGSLFDSAYNQITSASDNGLGNNFRIDRTLDPGTYFVEVTGQAFVNNNSGPYTLQVQGASGPSGHNDAFPLQPLGPSRFAAELARFASAAYLDSAIEGVTAVDSRGNLRYAAAAGWEPVRDLVPSAGVFRDGVFHDADSRAWAHLYLGEVDGKRTLVISFRGTDDLVSDIKDYLPHFESHFLRFAPLVSAVAKYIVAYGVEQTWVTGHSLGGAMAQMFISAVADGPGRLFRAATFGSPGALALDNTDPRVTHFENFADPVPPLGASFSNMVSGSRFVIDPDGRSLSPVLSAHDSELYVDLAEALATGHVATAPDGQQIADSSWAVYTGTAEAETLSARTSARSLLIGGGGSDQLRGGPLGDVLVGGEGSDLLDGQGGVDVARFEGLRQGYRLSVAGSTATVSQITGLGDADSLVGVERIAFADRSVALDLDGAAGMVAKTLGAVFGKASVARADYVGIGLYYMDRGLSYEALVQLALDARLGQNPSHTAVVTTLFSNVVGVAPSAQELASFTDLLAAGVYTPVSLGLLAADTSLNTANINLTGLASTGLEFFPFSGG